MEATTAQCAKHHFDRAVAVCGQCGLTFCPACLVYAFGPNKPPFCIPCALTVGGVRKVSSGPKISWREKRARKKALEAQNAAAADANLERALAEANAAADADVAPDPDEPAFDWSAPFDSSFDPFEQTALTD